MKLPSSSQKASSSTDTASEGGQDTSAGVLHHSQSRESVTTNGGKRCKRVGANVPDPYQPVHYSDSAGEDDTLSLGSLSPVHSSSEDDDMKENILPNWQPLDSGTAFGRAIITTSHGCPSTALCFSCASAGDNLLRCISCCEPWHFFCIERAFRPSIKLAQTLNDDHVSMEYDTTSSSSVLESFVCANCTSCCMCQKSPSDLRCSTCAKGYHAKCLSHYSAASCATKDTHLWTCPECAICRLCRRTFLYLMNKQIVSTTGDNSGTNNNNTTNTADVWSDHCDLCGECERALRQGEQCPECQRVYHGDCEDMLECDLCKLWVHRICARLSLDEYETLNTLGISVLRRASFRCSPCQRKGLPVHMTPVTVLAQQQLMDNMADYLGAFLKELRSELARNRATESTGGGRVPQLDGPFSDAGGSTTSDVSCVVEELQDEEEFEDGYTAGNEIHMAASELDTTSSLSSGAAAACLPANSLLMMVDVAPSQNDDLLMESAFTPLQDNSTDKVGMDNLKPWEGLSWDKWLYSDFVDAEHLVVSVRCVMQHYQRSNFCHPMNAALRRRFLEDTVDLFPWIETTQVSDKVQRVFEQIKVAEGTPHDEQQQLRRALEYFHRAAQSRAQQATKDAANFMVAHSPNLLLAQERMRRKEAFISQERRWLQKHAQTEKLKMQRLWKAFQESLRTCKNPSEAVSKLLSMLSDMAAASKREKDPRRCQLCHVYGDRILEGRLLYAGCDVWLHMNCALWSRGVYEVENSDELHEVHGVLQSAQVTRCCVCHGIGATVSCAHEEDGGGSCEKRMHFVCAVSVGAVFTVHGWCYCSEEHAPSNIFRRAEKMLLPNDDDEEEEEDMAVPPYEVALVHRRMLLPMDCYKRSGLLTSDSGFVKGLPVKHVRLCVGALQIVDLGHIMPLASDGAIISPIGFTCRRQFFAASRQGTDMALSWYTMRVASNEFDTNHLAIAGGLTLVEDAPKLPPVKIEPVKNYGENPGSPNPVITSIVSLAPSVPKKRKSFVRKPKTIDLPPEEAQSSSAAAAASGVDGMGSAGSPPFHPVYFPSMVRFPVPPLPEPSIRPHMVTASELLRQQHPNINVKDVRIGDPSIASIMSTNQTANNFGKFQPRILSVPRLQLQDTADHSRPQVWLPPAVQLRPPVQPPTLVQPPTQLQPQQLPTSQKLPSPQKPAPRPAILYLSTLKTTTPTTTAISIPRPSVTVKSSTPSVGGGSVLTITFDKKVSGPLPQPVNRMPQQITVQSREQENRTSVLRPVVVHQSPRFPHPQRQNLFSPPDTEPQVPFPQPRAVCVQGRKKQQTEPVRRKQRLSQPESHIRLSPQDSIPGQEHRNRMSQPVIFFNTERTTNILPPNLSQSGATEIQQQQTRLHQQISMQLQPFTHSTQNVTIDRQPLTAPRLVLHPLKVPEWSQSSPRQPIRPQGVRPMVISTLQRHLLQNSTLSGPRPPGEYFLPQRDGDYDVMEGSQLYMSSGDLLSSVTPWLHSVDPLLSPPSTTTTSNVPSQQPTGKKAVKRPRPTKPAPVKMEDCGGKEAKPVVKKKKEMPIKSETNVTTHYVVDGVTTSRGVKQVDLAWNCLLESVRWSQRMSLTLSDGKDNNIDIPRSFDGWRQFGLSHPQLVYLVEQLPLAYACVKYRFRYHAQRVHHIRARMKAKAQNPSGSARCENYTVKFVRPWRKAVSTASRRDRFGFLLCDAQRVPPYRPGTFRYQKERRLARRRYWAWVREQSMNNKAKHAGDPNIVNGGGAPVSTNIPDLDDLAPLGPAAEDMAMVAAANGTMSRRDLLSLQYKRLAKGHWARRVTANVFPSAIHARGLFALRDLAPNEMIVEYCGQKVRSALIDRREQVYRRQGEDCFLFRLDADWVVDATLKGNVARFINHSCEPNSYAKVVKINGQAHIVIFAQRKIRRGEEITYDYCFPRESDKVHCNCGADSCRKYLN